MPSCVDGVNGCLLVVYSMGRLWRHVLSVASKRAGRPPLRLQAFPIAGRLEVTAGSDSQPPYKTKCLFAFRLAVVSDQRWFCGPRCVDGLTRGLSPELEHGTTLKTRDFRGFKASWKTASQAGSGPHSVGSKGPPPGAQTNDQPKRANKKRLAARDEVVFVVPPKFSKPRSQNGKRNPPSNDVTCRTRHRLLKVQPWSFGNDTGQKERALAFHHR